MSINEPNTKEVGVQVCINETSIANLHREITELKKTIDECYDKLNIINNPAYIHDKIVRNQIIRTIERVLQSSEEV